jgi:hypothetical protein
MDLHIHSCLSPCGDEDMTPGSIAGIAKLNGLDIAALTDHNACGNCRSFFAACEHYGVIPVAGMELTTSEDVHLLCLFRTLTDAEAFAAAVAQKRVRIKNRPEIFGRQLLMGRTTSRPARKRTFWSTRRASLLRKRPVLPGNMAARRSPRTSTARRTD